MARPRAQQSSVAPTVPAPSPTCSGNAPCPIAPGQHHAAEPGSGMCIPAGHGLSRGCWWRRLGAMHHRHKDWGLRSPAASSSPQPLKPSCWFPVLLQELKRRESVLLSQLSLFIASSAGRMAVTLSPRSAAALRPQTALLAGDCRILIFPFSLLPLYQPTSFSMAAQAAKSHNKPRWLLGLRCSLQQ